MNFRTQLEIELYCSKHPEERLSLDFNKSKMSADSAYTVIPKVSVNPCARCENELDRIKSSIKTLMDIKNEEVLKPLQDLDDAK